MPRFFSVSAPAALPAFFLASALLLQGCSLLPQKDAAAANGSAAVTSGAPVRSGADDKAPQRDAFSIDVKAPPNIADYLTRHLELQRFRQLSDLTATELSRLLGAADANTRELLGTLGYFSPTLQLEMRETPDSTVAQREVIMTVEPGRQTRISDVSIDFTGPIQYDPSADAQREDIVGGWSLRPGQGFTQTGWDSAKNGGQRKLNRLRFPTGTISHSLADVDADAAEAHLSVTYDSGPAFSFGPLQTVPENTQRYGHAAVRLLARLPTGADYDESVMLQAQLRLASSGYYDSVFLVMDTEAPDPLTAPVIAQLREAQYQRLVFGVGISTDIGARFSIDHIHNEPIVGWRALSKLAYDNETATISSDWMSLPNESGWRKVVGGSLKREEVGSYTVNSSRVRGGRSQEDGNHIDRSHILQFDSTHNQGLDAPPSASAVSLTWGWTGRYFDSLIAPSRGMGLAVEVGPGITLTGERLPFGRVYARWLGFLPTGEVRADDGSMRRSRLALRAEAGAVVAKDTARIPNTLMFLTGGDTTVRGYGYRKIGVRINNGETYAGHYLLSGSVEWQRPLVIGGEMTDFEAVTFIDAGAVADKLGDMSVKVGVGVGGRWRSPIGAIQFDLAYGVAVKRLRAHLQLGFSF